MTLEQIHKAVKEGWHPSDGTPLMDFIWNAALDATAEECNKGDSPYDAECERYFAGRALALKKGGTR